MMYTGSLAVTHNGLWENRLEHCAGTKGATRSACVFTQYRLQSTAPIL